MSTRNTETEFDDLEYVTRVDVNLAILHEIAKIRFRERFREIGPLIAQGIVKNLVAAGVDFSQVDFSKVTEPTDEELDAIYEDFNEQQGIKRR
jgi:hypothetical protein